MFNLGRFSNIQNNKKKNEKFFIVFIVLFCIVSVIRDIIKSGGLIFCIVVLLIGVFFCLCFKYILRDNASKPASLGKNYSRKYPVIIQYMPPKGINPAEAGLLYNCKVDVTDLTSLIYQWTLDGLLKIKNISGKDSNKIEKIELLKINDIPEDHPFFEKEIFNSIFLSSEKKTVTYAFQLKYALLLEDLEIHGMEKGWLYRPSTTKIGKVIYSILIVLLIMSFILIFNVGSYEIYVIASFCLLLLICIFLGGYIFGGKSLKLTDEGARLASHLIGYRNFIKSCDAKKIEFFLKQDPLFIDRTLPYATAFGIETDFIKKISPLKRDFYSKHYSGNIESNLSSIIKYFLRS